MRILKEDVLCLVVDFQERLVPVIAEKEKLLQKTATLLNGLQALEVPLLVTQQYTKGLGETVPEIANTLGDFNTPYDKLSFSCYEDSEIKQALDASGRRTILLCGIEAHICVLQTALDLLAAGYRVVLAEDCVSSRSLADKAIGLKRLMQEGVLFTCCESILFELTRRAGTPAFKTISKLVK